MYDERIFYFIIILQTEFHMFHIQILSKHSYTCTVTHHITTVIGTHITATHIVTCTDIHNQSYTYTVTYHITIVIDTATNTDTHSHTSHNHSLWHTTTATHTITYTVTHHITTVIGTQSHTHTHNHRHTGIQIHTDTQLLHAVVTGGPIMPIPALMCFWENGCAFEKMASYVVWNPIVMKGSPFKIYQQIKRTIPLPYQIVALCSGGR